MRKFIVIALLCVFMPLSALKELPSKIGSVTVYNDRALVERNGTVALEQGVFEIYIGALPSSIDQNSINVDVEGTGIKLANIVYKTIYLKEETNRNADEIKRKIAELQRQVQSLNNQNTALQNQIDTLKSIKAKVESDTQKQFSQSVLNIEALGKTLSFITRELAKTMDVMYDNQIKIGKLREDIDYQNKLLSEITSRGKEERRIYIKGRSDSARTYSFSVKYIAYNAYWSPTYRVYLTEDKAKINMEYYASVSQNTGENWNDVNLTLSTSVPRFGVKAPILAPYYLYNYSYQPKPKMAKRALAPSMAKEELKAGALDEAPTAYDYEPPAEVEENAYSVEYRAKMAATVPSGNEERTIYLITQEVKGENIFTAVPRMEKKVYAQIKTKNEGKAPILPGKVSVFYGTSFIGDFEISQVLPGEEYTLDLGPVNYVKVDFKLEKRKYIAPGILGGNKKYEFEYSLSAKNLTSDAYKIVVIDRIPVSNDSKIKVNDIKLIPEGFEKDDKTGIVKWTIDIKGKAEVKFKNEYVIEFPKDYNVNL